MKRLEVSGAVRPLLGSLGVKGFRNRKRVLFVRLPNLPPPCSDVTGNSGSPKQP